jgi:hypothetical protein
MSHHNVCSAISQPPLQGILDSFSWPLIDPVCLTVCLLYWCCRGYMGLRPLPDVLSLSWGSAQPAPPGAEEIETVIASNAILAKLAAMGVTVVASSGDYGNYGISTATCDCELPGHALNFSTPAGCRSILSCSTACRSRLAVFLTAGVGPGPRAWLHVIQAACQPNLELVCSVSVTQSRGSNLKVTMIALI